jgi:hypothetical protein
MSKPRGGTRRWNEPKLEIGNTMSIEEGLAGVVLARYPQSGDVRTDVLILSSLGRRTRPDLRQ